MEYIKIASLLIFISILRGLVYADTGINEKPIFQGNKRYTNAELNEIISEDWQKYLSNKEASYIDDAAYKIMNHYKENGYYFAEIDYEITGQTPVFNIREYNQILIKSISFINSKDPQKTLSFSEERLNKFITDAPHLGKRLLKKSQISKDVEAIHDFYLSEGYLEQSSKVVYNFNPPDEASEVIINIMINEGPRYFLDHMEFYGNLTFDAEKLEKVLKFSESIVYYPRMHHRMASTLKDFYREQGYARVQVLANVIKNQESETGIRQSCTIRFEIQEGKINYIRTISVKGNELTLDEVILRQLDIHEGDVFDSCKIRKSEENIQNTGLFLWAEIEEKEVEDHWIDLTVSVEEKNTKLLTFLLGYDTTYGVTGGLEFEHINLFGTGRKMLFSADSTLVTTELFKAECSLKLIEPQLFGSRTWSAEMGFFALYEETPSFTVFDRGAGPTVYKKVTKYLSAQIGYRALWSQILDVQDEFKDVEEKTTFFSTLCEKIILDLRNDPSYPTSGSYSFVEFEESLTALYSDVDYLKVYMHTAWYFPVISRCVFSVALRGGVIVPFADTLEIPIQRRYFSGGANSVRSFKEKQMPPLNEKDNPVGGEGIFLLSTELRIPVYGNLGVSGFADIGQIMPKVRAIEDYRISKLKYALGFSLWYQTPIGPIRFDMGFNPDRSQNPLTAKKESLFEWFLSIGFSF